MVLGPEEPMARKSSNSLVYIYLWKSVRVGACLFAAAIFAIGTGGCSDPYSAKRINLRLSSQADLAQDVLRGENRHLRRCGEAFQTVDKWWRRDSERFIRRVPTIGDYVW